MLSKAKWIWHKESGEVNEYVDFIHDFYLYSVDPHAYLQISVDSEYVLYINGALVGVGQYSDYPERKCYDSFVVSEHLKAGKNRIAVAAYYQGESGLRYVKGERGLIFALSNYDRLVISDRTTLSRLSPTYRSGRIHLTNWFMGFGYEYDARPGDSFQGVDYALSKEWLPSIEKEVKTTLNPRPVSKLTLSDPAPARVIAQGVFLRRSHDPLTSVLMHTDYLSTVNFEDMFEGEKTFPITLGSFDKSADGIYFLVDLGRERCGYLHFDLTVNEGARIDISHGEHLEDLRVRSKVKGNNFADTYIAKGGRQSFTHYTRRIASRYLEVHISALTELTVNYLGVVPADYPFTAEATFNCSDGIHTRIFDTCLCTLKMCMHEHYEDGPWREQALYGSDARNASICAHYTLGGSLEFTRASLDLLAQSVLNETYVNLCAPALKVKTIPSFTMLWFLAVSEYTDFSGDLSFAREWWPLMKRMMANITSNSRGGILRPVPIDGIEPWNFYEWSEDQSRLSDIIRDKGDRIDDGLYHLFCYMAVDASLRLAKKLNDAQYVSTYTKTKNEIKSVFNRKFWDEERGVFSSHLLDGEPLRYDELTQALSVFTGICHDSYKERVLSALANPDGSLVKLSLSYMIYKHEALLGEGMKYAPVVFEEISRIWGGMLFRGATTFWECEGGTEDYSAACSLCHAWSATPIIIYAKYVLGVEFKDGRVTVSDTPACSDYFSHFSAKLPIIDHPIEKH